MRSPWMTKCISKSVRQKTTRSPNKTNENKYKIYKNKLNHIIKIAKKKHDEEQFIKYKNDIKMTWKTINKIVNKKILINY